MDLQIFSKDNFLKRHSNKHVVFRQRLLPVAKFPSGLLVIVQVSYVMGKNTFAISKILERKGERLSFILHHEDELSMLCTASQCTEYGHAFCLAR